MDRTIPPSTGYQDITQNIGATRNTGIELALSAITLDGWHGLPWTNDITFSKNKNEIVALERRRRAMSGNLWFVGMPINGGGNSVYATTCSTASGRRPTPRWRSSAAGPVRSASSTSNGDGKFNDHDKVILGNTYPKWSGSYSTRIDYKFLDFGAQAITRQGSWSATTSSAATRWPAGTTA
jgi:hypothetical protein